MKIERAKIKVGKWTIDVIDDFFVATHENGTNLCCYSNGKIVQTTGE